MPANRWYCWSSQELPPTHTTEEPKNITGQTSQSVGSKSEEAKTDTKNLEEIAQEFLSEQFELTLTDFKESTSDFEITVSAEGASDRDDQTKEPEDWLDFQLRMISAQARMSETLKSEKDTTIYMRDSNDDLMLSVRGGRIIFDKYEKEKPSASSSADSGKTIGGGSGNNFNTYFEFS